MEKELIPYSTVAELVSVWLDSEKKIREGYKLLRDAEQALKDVFKDTYRFDLMKREYTLSDVDKTINDVKIDIWRELIQKMGLRRVLSVEKAKRLDKYIQEGKLEDGSPLPDITEESIMSMMKSFTANINDFLEEAVVEVFGFLRPRHGNYKTNKKFEVGKRVILSNRVHSRYRQFGYTVNYYYDAELRALDNVFHLLDGAGSVKTYRGPLIDAIETSEYGQGETDYFKFKCFKNCNLHIEFKRLDLLNKLNKVAGGANLKE